MEKTNKIQITTKASDNTISVKNIQNKITMPLNGNQIDGVYAEVFDKIYQRVKLEELYDELIDKGIIEEGKVADLTIFNPDEKYIYTEDMIVSKAKNSPFIGKELKGKVKYTMVGGRIVYEG